METLQNLPGTLMEIFFQLLKILLLTGIGFAGGYLYAVFFRSPKQRASGLADLESDLKHLEEETGRAKREVNDLLNKTQRGQRRPTIKQGTYIADEETGMWAKLTKRVARLLGRDDHAEPEVPNSVVERLRQLKSEINYIAKNIHDTIPFINSGQAQRNEEAGATDITSDQQPIHVDLEPQDLNLSDEQPRRLDLTTDTQATDRSYLSKRLPEGRGASGGYSASRRSPFEVDKEIIELYNQAVNDSFAREQFRESVPTIRVGTVNAVERRQNPALDAEFKEASDGDFFAFAINGANTYAVVPRLGLTIEAIRYSAGAVGEVFDKTRNYDSQHFYSRYRVRQPAIFKCDGDRWQLLQSGELDLGPSD
jgi:hypothetical protein